MQERRAKAEGSTQRDGRRAALSCDRAPLFGGRCADADGIFAYVGKRARLCIVYDCENRMTVRHDTAALLLCRHTDCFTRDPTLVSAEAAFAVNECDRGG